MAQRLEAGIYLQLGGSQPTTQAEKWSDITENVDTLLLFYLTEAQIYILKAVVYHNGNIEVHMALDPPTYLPPFSIYVVTSRAPRYMYALYIIVNRPETMVFFCGCFSMEVSTEAIVLYLSFLIPEAAYVFPQYK